MLYSSFLRKNNNIWTQQIDVNWCADNAKLRFNLTLLYKCSIRERYMPKNELNCGPFSFRQCVKDIEKRRGLPGLDRAVGPLHLCRHRLSRLPDSPVHLDGRTLGRLWPYASISSLWDAWTIAKQRRKNAHHKLWNLFSQKMICNTSTDD